MPPFGKRPGTLVRQERPFNAGPAPADLRAAAITPSDLFFVRNHGDVPETSNGAAPDTLLGRKELAERIRAALDDLPFDQRTALVLREIDGLSYDEIGFSLGIAVGTVKSRLARAREALRARLRDV